MNFTTRVLLSSVVSTLVVSNSMEAGAQGTASRPDAIFKALDKNGDGVITASEVGEQRERFFNRLVRVGDKNKDGKLTRDEFLSAANRTAPNARTNSSRFGGTGRFGRSGRSGATVSFDRLDRNRNGKVSMSELPQYLRSRYKPVFDRLGKTELTRAEFGSAARRTPSDRAAARRRAETFFNQLDTNKDGKLTLKETPERMKRLVESLFRRARKSTDGELTKDEFLRQSSTRSGANSSGQGAAYAILRRFDKNGDRAISKDEAQGGLKENFEKIDTNKNGKLEPAELGRIQRDRPPAGKRPPQRKRPKR